jgi:hypothetical protein
MDFAIPADETSRRAGREAWSGSDRAPYARRRIEDNIRRMAPLRMAAIGA